MNDSTKRLPRASRLPQAALERIDKVISDLLPLTQQQRTDLSLIIHGGRSSAAA